VNAPTPIYKCLKPFVLFNRRLRSGDAVSTKGLPPAKILKMLSCRLICVMDEADAAREVARLQRASVAGRSAASRARSLGVAERTQSRATSA
jgi:hypothetical protein